MKSFLFLFLLITSVFGTNPKVFSQLGDRLYNHMYGMERLREIEEFAPYRVELDHYILELQKAKQKGFDIEYKRSNDVDGYLKLLRQLAKQDQFYVKKAYEVYRSSMKNKQYKLFSQIVSSGLIDLEKEKQKILSFYFQHKEEIPLYSGTKFSQIVAQEEAKRASRAKYDAAYYKRLREEEEKRKIRRLREKERLRMERRKRELELELKRKKERIRQEQLQQLHEEI